MKYTTLVCSTVLILSCTTDNDDRAPFPESFEWGTGTSAWQIEGGNATSDWTQWEDLCVLDELDGVRSDGETIADCHKNDDGPDSWNLYGQDFALANSMGHTAVRLGIEWAKIEPIQGSFDQSAIAHYRAVLQRARDEGLEPMVTLQHFTLPTWVHDIISPQESLHGWPGAPGSAIGDAAIIDAFERYSRAMAEELGDLVDIWVTINEPMSTIFGAYVAGMFPPGENLKLEKAVHCTYNVAYAHAKAYRAIHQADLIDASGNGEAATVSIAKHWRAFTPDFPDKSGAVESAIRFDHLFNRILVNAITRGEIDLNVDQDILDDGEGVRDELKNTLDWMGVNFYGRFMVSDSIVQICDDTPCGEDEGLMLPLFVQENTDPSRKYSDLAWELYPEGFIDVLNDAWSYGLPIRITENGLADEADLLRPSFMVSHIDELQKAFNQGIDIRGYYHWSLIDNLEWAEGYTPRFGMVHIDYDSPEKTRTPRESSQAYSDIIEAGGITDAIVEQWGTLY